MVISGLSQLKRSDFDILKGKRLAVMANHTATDESGEVLWSILMERGLNVSFLLAVEHGLWAVEQDMVPVETSVDDLTGLPILSLYGTTEDSLNPDIEALSRVDAVVFDIQDVGSRYYTYQASLQRLLRALNGTGVEAIVLDRPNPLGGEIVEGNMVQEEFFSFVGQVPFPNRHGLTMGEMANYFIALEHLDVELTVVALADWSREAYWQMVFPLWVPPSPNMPTPMTALVYPGGCFLEGTNLSEGRGTTTPFQLLGAPWMKNPGLIVEKMQVYQDMGVILRPCKFLPAFQKWKDEVCEGVFVHVHSRLLFQPVRYYLMLIKAIRDLYPSEFKFRKETYEFVSDRLPFDLLAGGSEIRNWLEEGSFESGEQFLEEQFSQFEDEFLLTRADYLRY